MKSTPAQVARFLSLTWVPVSISHFLLYALQRGDPYGITMAAKAWDFWLAVVLSVYVGLRIAQRDPLAWWIGLIGAGYLLYVRVPYIPVAMQHGFPVFPLGITLVWLAAFVGALVAMQVTRTRRAA